MKGPRQRIRQRTKPRSNRLETEFGNKLRWEHPNAPLYEQAITFLLANGVRYTPDWVMEHPNGMFCYEVKGKKSWDDAIVKIKMAPTIFPRFKWILADKVEGQWRTQEVLP